ncbi:GPW/gp25 family protein [uncultured Pseudacidovorax sp.]|uniref:GPW/gp25 family protein n=1 Tax=uncultured Pseudacidovorax sp. TaxID=679313 RepID=UPI0025E7BABE|nr:GPW/gp25 family protein [uncultured Pseudacidovorax sp.]
MTGVSNLTGRRLTRRDHISQSIGDILTTPIGERLMRRNYGSFIPQLLDHPATPANRLRLIAATAQAIIKWEPRTRVRGVAVSITAQGRCTLAITRRDLAAGEDVTATVTLQRGGA